VQGESATTEPTVDEWRARVAELESALAAERARADALVAERDRLRAAYRQLQIDIELLRRRIFVAKAERVDTRQLELEFKEKKKELDELVRRLDIEASPAPPPPDAPKGRKKRTVAATSPRSRSLRT
jgi:chromosome segregation ATPase